MYPVVDVYVVPVSFPDVCSPLIDVYADVYPVTGSVPDNCSIIVDEVQDWSVQLSRNT